MATELFNCDKLANPGVNKKLTYIDRMKNGIISYQKEGDPEIKGIYLAGIRYLLDELIKTTAERVTEEGKCFLECATRTLTYIQDDINRNEQITLFMKILDWISGRLKQCLTKDN